MPQKNTFSDLLIEEKVIPIEGMGDLVADNKKQKEVSDYALKVYQVAKEYDKKPATKENIKNFYNKIGQSSNTFSDGEKSFLPESVLVIDNLTENSGTKAPNKIVIPEKKVKQHFNRSKKASEVITKKIGNSLDVIVLERLHYVWRDNGGKPKKLFENYESLAKEKPVWINRFW